VLPAGRSDVTDRDSNRRFVLAEALSDQAATLEGEHRGLGSREVSSGSVHRPEPVVCASPSWANVSEPLFESPAGLNPSRIFLKVEFGFISCVSVTVLP
jgi:hypothetical protein